MFILYFASCVNPIWALLAYDCDVQTTHQAVYDIRSPKQCPELFSQYLDPENITIQIFQELETEDIVARNCLMTMSRKVTWCGVDSLSYGSQWLIYERLTELTPSQCRDLHEKKFLSLEGQTFMIEIGIPRSYSFFSNGTIDSQGN
jgi:hypothetical protein